MKHVAVVDCAIKTLVTPCFNRLVTTFSEVRFTYHPVGFYGMDSLYELESLDGLMILGSASNVDEPQYLWHGPLSDYILSMLYNQIPTFGICFGHQLVAAMFGAEVGHFSVHGTKLLGSRESRVAGGRLLAVGEKLILPISHCQVVKTLPECMGVWLESVDHPFDGLFHKEFPYWGLQQHPESSRHFLTHDIKNIPEAHIPFIQDHGEKVIRAFINKVMES